MKLHEWLSPRTVTIVGILIVLLAICFHFFLRHNDRQFEANLPKISKTEHASGLSNVSSHAEKIAFEPEQISLSKRDIVPVDKNENFENAGTQELVSEAACSMCGTSHMDGMDASEPKPKLYAGLTGKQVHQLFGEPGSSNTMDPNEKYDLYGDVLIAAMGPDPRIPRLVDNLKTANVLHQMAKKQAESNYSHMDVDNYLSLQPAVIATELAEITIDLFNYSPEKAAAKREFTRRIIEGVEIFKLLQETRPIVQASIDVGDISVKEGEEFIQAATGLNVVMHSKDRRSTVENSMSPAEDFNPYEVPSPTSAGDLKVLESLTD